eukprot:scaffold168064_cov21-Tisochrysis_lutea.AAC.2
MLCVGQQLEGKHSAGCYVLNNNWRANTLPDVMCWTTTGGQTLCRMLCVGQQLEGKRSAVCERKSLWHSGPQEMVRSHMSDLRRYPLELLQVVLIWYTSIQVSYRWGAAFAAMHSSLIVSVQSCASLAP